MLKQQFKGIVLGILAAIIFAAGATATAQTTRSEARPEVAKYAKVFVDSEGLEVTLLRVGPRERNQYLVGVSGVDHPWDGQIFLHTMEDVSSNYRPRFEYAMPYKGRTYTTIILRGNSYGEFYLEGERHERSIYLSEELSNNVIPEHFLTRYLQQSERDGRSANLELRVDPALLQTILQSPVVQSLVVTQPTQSVRYTQTRTTKACKQPAAKRQTRTVTVQTTAPKTCSNPNVTIKTQKRSTRGTIEARTDNRRNSVTVEVPAASLSVLGVDVNVNR